MRKLVLLLSSAVAARIKMEELSQAAVINPAMSFPAIASGVDTKSKLFIEHFKMQIA
jgi:hypothetical protein